MCMCPFCVQPFGLGVHTIKGGPALAVICVYKGVWFAAGGATLISMAGYDNVGRDSRHV
jgi:hypothetical protein